MNRNYIFLVAFTLLLTSCASTSLQLANKGFEKYSQKDYTKANKLFDKALKKKGTKEKAYEGKAFVSSKFQNYRDAEFYISKAYSINPKSANHTYNYACFSNLNGKPNQAMNLLYEIPAKGNFEYYRKLASKDKGLESLKSNQKFIRYLSGFRRLKIQPYSAYSDISDGWFNQNDLFVVVENNGKIILVTDVVQESNNANWNNDYVVFDYPLESKIRIILMDEDIFEHDKFIYINGLITKPDDYNFTSGNSYLKVNITDVESYPYTTGTYLPSEVSLTELALGVGALYLVSKADDLDNSFLTRLIDCSTKAGISYYVENPIYAAAIEEAYDSVKEKRGYSFSNLSGNAIKSLVIDELRDRGYSNLANLIEVADYANCVFSK